MTTNKNLWVIPTDKPSRLQLFKGINEFEFELCSKDSFFNKGVHIYITNDEEIKEGDWLFDLDIKRIVKADNLKVITSKKSQCWYYKKIILTTDQSLNGVQAIDDEFLEWFVKNPSCEEVEVISFEKYHEFSGDVGYEIITQKEEPKQESCEYVKEVGCIKDICTCNTGPKQDIIKTEEDAKIFVETLEKIPEPNEKLKKAFKNYNKQETLEEAAEREYPTIHEQYQYDAFIEGAKWQAERMYSEKDMKEAFNGFKSGKSFIEWFEQFKISAK